ncbi:MAG: hypothetical protein WBG69_10075, partial [Arcobacteraceae bacterium]
MYKKLIVQSLKDVFDNYPYIARVVAVPLILLLILNTYATAYLTPDENPILMVAVTFVSLLVDMIIVISVHRVLILGSDSLPFWGLTKYTKREFAFFLRYVAMIAFYIITALLFVVFFQILQIHIFVAILVVTVLFTIFLSRVSLVFPSIAIDKPMSFETAWRYTKKYKLLCFLMIILFPLFFSAIVGGIYAFIINILVTTISVHFN